MFEAVAETILGLFELAYMATSGGHFSWPSGMGSFWSKLVFVILCIGKE